MTKSAELVEDVDVFYLYLILDNWRQADYSLQIGHCFWARESADLIDTIINIEDDNIYYFQSGAVINMFQFKLLLFKESPFKIEWSVRF